MQIAKEQLELRKKSKEQLLTYQRRKPKMSDMELISLSLTSEFLGVDNMPLEACMLSRNFHSKICREDTYSFLDKGGCAAQGVNYFGYMFCR